MKIIVDADRLELAKEFKGTGVEIGVAEGWYSNEVMKLGKVTEMYGIDPYLPHQGYRDYTRETTYQKLQAKALERLYDYTNYHFIGDFSMAAVKRFADNSLDFVYIDGDHSYEAVTDDIKAWWLKLKRGGIMAGDDYIKSARDKRFYDVIKAVDEFVTTNNLKLYLYTAGRTPTNWMVYK